MEYVSHPWIAPNAIEKRAYQERILASAASANTLVVLPTGMGKTSVAALVTAHCLEKRKGKIMFLAPTRPLVAQHLKTFSRFMRAGLEMAAVTGSTPPSERRKIYAKSDVIFSTPQTVENDLSSGVLSLDGYSLCIFDEAHRAVGNYAYTRIAEAFSSLILALTASPGADRRKIDEVKRLLKINNVEIRSREDEDVKPYVQLMNEEYREVALTKEMESLRTYLTAVKDSRMKKLMSWGIVKSPLSKIQILKLQEELSKSDSNYRFMAMSVLAEVLKVDHAILLLETQTIYSLKKYFDRLVAQRSRAVERLLKDDALRSAMRLTVTLSEEGKEHPKIAALKQIVTEELAADRDARIMVFAQFRDSIEKICRELKSVKGAAPVQFIGQAKKSGAGLSQKEQIQILNEFSMGFHNVLVASSVGEEGLDVAETGVVIFYEPTPSAIRRIQRSGRTARTKEGKVIFLVTKGTRDEAYHWAGYQKERSMKKILYALSGSLKRYG
ncbi:MAG: DEAD/DEAH box helicase family protein [Candidatus Aenigmarchaeota archaeon]|nr:DEAD/DEAH box helicase family protein [Candidatus Aenigmarchaeota archaeon]